MNRRNFTKLMAGLTGSSNWFTDGNGWCAEPSQPGSQSAPSAAEPPAGNVYDFRELARRKLSEATFGYLDTGSADQVTLRENVAAFRRLQLLPPLLTGVATADLSTTVLGCPVRLPILLAPVAAQRLFHPQGAMAAARAAAAVGTVFGVSSSVMNSVEEVADAADGPKWFQLYPPKDRDVARKLVERAERAGYRALIVTVDLGEMKDADRRNGFVVPKAMLLKHLHDAGITNVDASMSHEQLVAFNSRQWDLSFSWQYFEWLRTVTKLPLIIKGVLRPDDARRAASIGLDGIVVSNHGGRRLDTVPASIEMLPEIVSAVGGKTEIYLDSGVRRGTDVLKALALGARAVLIGRPYAWALAAAGESGVRNVLQLLRDELHLAMVACGCAAIADIEPSLIRK